MQIAYIFVPSSDAVVNQICWPHTTGEDQPFPGISVFHRTFEFSLHSTATSAVSARPLPSPRNDGQGVSANKEGEWLSAVSRVISRVSWARIIIALLQEFRWEDETVGWEPLMLESCGYGVMHYSSSLTGLVHSLKISE